MSRGLLSTKGAETPGATLLPCYLGHGLPPFLVYLRSGPTCLPLASPLGYWVVF